MGSVWETHRDQTGGITRHCLPPSRLPARGEVKPGTPSCRRPLPNHIGALGAKAQAFWKLGGPLRAVSWD